MQQRWETNLAHRSVWQHVSQLDLCLSLCFCEQTTVHVWRELQPGGASWAPNGNLHKMVQATSCSLCVRAPNSDVGDAQRIISKCGPCIVSFCSQENDLQLFKLPCFIIMIAANCGVQRTITTSSLYPVPNLIMGKISISQSNRLSAYLPVAHKAREKNKTF